MLIAGGGGGYGGTDWNSKDVRYMWSAIADQDTDKHYDVVSGWRQTADLTLTHLGQVRMYRDNLASVWPPSKSPAAAAYIDRLDSLITSLQATHDAASANYTAFATVTLTLSLARNKLKPIADQYEANEKANLAWQAKIDAQTVDPTEPPKISFPPVSSVQQEQLNNQARVIMYDLSSTVISGQSALQKPKPYDPNDLGSSDGEERTNRNDGSGFAVPPIIPPPGGGSVASTRSSTPSSSFTTSQGNQLHTPPIIPTSGGGHPTGQIGGGPVLGGAGPGTISPPASPPTLPPTPTPGPTPAPSPPGLIPGLLNPGNGGMLPSATYAPGTSRLPGGTIMRPSGAAPTGRVVNPPGGVIGSSPSGNLIGQTPSTAPRSRPGSPARVNPVGGVIEPNGSRTGRGSPPRTPLHPQSTNAFATPSRTRDQRDDGSGERHWDPDNPWATDEGVDPVLMPPPEAPPIDPGPAIGYHR